jgi:hypothetical protein
VKAKVGRWWLVLLPLAAVAAFVLARPGLSAPPAAPAGPACATGSLHARVVNTDTGLGTTAMTVALTSGSATACRLPGVPAVDLLDAQRRLVSRAVPATGGPASAGLAGAAEASFVLTYRNFDSVTGEQCAPVAELAIGLPGSPGQITVAATLSPCGRVFISEIRTDEGKGYP